MESSDLEGETDGRLHVEFGREPSVSDVVRRIVTFERTLADQLATRVDALPFGIARICPDLPEVYDASAVEATRPVSADELLRTVESVFVAAGLRHRRVHTTVAEVASSIGPTLVSRGWSQDRWVYMAHDRRSSAAISARGYATVDINTWAPAARAFVADERWGRDPAVVAGMAARDRRLAARIDVRFVLTDDATAGCHIYRSGQIAQIENIYVLTRARGTGTGRTVLTGALRECSDAELVFLVAEADGWPRHWYARNGFVEITTGWNWLRKPIQERVSPHP